MNAAAEEARRYRERAAKLQTTAEGVTDAKVAKKLLEQAAEYEWMASNCEQHVPAAGFRLRKA
jgi:hypothetical protein